MRYTVYMRNKFGLFLEMLTGKSSSRERERSISYLYNTGKPVFNYAFLLDVSEDDYPFFLSEAYLIKFGRKLNLKNPKTINEKIQWLKLYDNLPIKKQLTDKVLVRDWVKEKIGEECLKPVLWTGDKFDDIPFEEFPKNFIIKCSHASKWNIEIKDKQKVLTTPAIYNLIRNKINEYLNKSFFYQSDFETQYKGIIPRLIIEPMLIENPDESEFEYEIYCFNSKPKIFRKYKVDLTIHKSLVSTFDENYKKIDLSFFSEVEVPTEFDADDNLKKAVELSKVLSKEFKFVRVDWIIYKNMLYFGEMTFSPHSGFFVFGEKNKKWQLELGNMLNLKGAKYG